MKPRIAAAVMAMTLGVGTDGMAQGPVTSYGPEQDVYGSCRPTVMLTNTTKDTIDYLQIDVRYELHDGRTVVAEHKSRYRYGVADPIAPGSTHALIIHHDESTPLGAPCADLLKGTIVAFICRTTVDQDCAGLPGLRVGVTLALPRR